jgi:hypothetical protein
MSDYSRAFDVACVPGPMATANMARLSDGAPVLVVYLDPVKVTLQGAPTEDGWRELADFCRGLACESARLAAAIDPDGEPAPPEAYAPRHLLVRNEFGESGGGH